ncbi:integration host factor subunit alpha [Candidatus Poribacteria bacterium]|nr:integration host factor subunit alpha [Candidatus Poribacteria bacterium]
MTKADLASAVADQMDITKKQAEESVNAIIASIRDALAEGDDVRLVGFGTFSVKQRKARTGRNPRTGEELKIPAKKVPVFSAGKGLKEAVM